MRYLLLSRLIVFAIAIYGYAAYCPDKDFIKPCNCFRQGALLKCDNIDDLDAIQGAFRRSAGYDFDVVELYFLTTLYIPFDLFQNNSVNSLRLWYSDVSKIFDKPPIGLGALKLLEIRNTTVSGGVTWEFLSTLTSLQRINIFATPIKVIKKELSQYGSETLKELNIQMTDTRSVKSGAFEKFINLQKFTLMYNHIKEIRRDIFPRPFNSILQISFGYNKIKNVPEDMFTGMPNLWYVDFNRNQLTTISSSMFVNYPENLRLVVTGCPIVCDLKLCWMYSAEKMYRVDGACHSPERLKYYVIKTLSKEDMHCK